VPRPRSCLVHNGSQDLTLQKGEGYSSSLPIVKVSTKTLSQSPYIIYHSTLKTGKIIEDRWINV